MNMERTRTQPGHRVQERKEGTLIQRSGLNRREFLQAAAGGSAGLAAGSLILPATPVFAESAHGSDSSQGLPEWANVDAFQGVVESIHGDGITLNTGTSASPLLRTVSVVPTSRLWLAGQMGTRLPQVGDVLLVRSVIPGQIELGWVNLVSFDAQVLQTTMKGLDVAFSHPGGRGQEEISVDITSAIEWYNSIARAMGRPAQPLAGAHILGFRAGSSVVATSVWYVTEADAEALQARPVQPQRPVVTRVQVSPDYSYCVISWSGNTSYFNCPTGQGACGTCNTNNNSQGAWPYILNRQNCDNGCTGQCALKCGDSFLFYPCGNGTGTWLTVVDIGPCELSGPDCSCGTNNSKAVCHLNCPGDPCGLGGSPPRLMDLTAPTMARFFGSSGCATCKVGIACLCNNCTCPY
jgi:hypothetical protein